MDFRVMRTELRRWLRRGGDGASRPDSSGGEAPTGSDTPEAGPSREARVLDLTSRLPATARVEFSSPTEELQRRQILVGLGLVLGLAVGGTLGFWLGEWRALAPGEQAILQVRALLAQDDLSITWPGHPGRRLRLMGPLPSRLHDLAAPFAPQRLDRLAELALLSRAPEQRSSEEQFTLALLHLRRPDEARQVAMAGLELDELLKRGANDVRVLNALAVARVLEGKLTEASQGLEEALTKEPAHPVLLFNAAVVARAQGALGLTAAYRYESRYFAVDGVSPWARELAAVQAAERVYEVRLGGGEKGAGAVGPPPGGADGKRSTR